LHNHDNYVPMTILMFITIHIMELTHSHTHHGNI